MAANFNCIQDEKGTKKNSLNGKLVRLNFRKSSMKTEQSYSNFVKSSSSLTIKNYDKFHPRPIKHDVRNYCWLRAARKIFSSRSDYDHVKTSALIPFNSSTRYSRLAEIKSADSLNTLSLRIPCGHEKWWRRQHAWTFKLWLNVIMLCDSDHH